MRAPAVSLGEPLRVVGLLGHNLAERHLPAPEDS
jgi:hypothetical protein